MNRAGGKTVPAGRGGGRAPGAGIEPLLLEVEVYLTNRCNLDCSYCSARYMIREEGAHKLTLEQLRLAFDRIASDRRVRERFGGRVKITFKGGEPLLEYKAIEGAVKYIRGKKYGFEIGITTNGTLLTPDRMAFLAGNGVEVCVSIDGYKSVNDFHRKFKCAGNRSVFDAVMGNLKKMLGNESCRNHIHIGTTFTAQTISSAPGVVDYFSRRLGFKQLKIGVEVYGIWSRAGIKALRAVFKALKARFLEALGREMAAGNMEALLGEVQFSQYMRNLPNVWPDGAALNELAANPVALFYDGFFYPCDFALRPPLEEKYRIGGLESGIDFEKLDKLSLSPMFADIPRKCAHRVGLLSPVERLCWAAVNGFSAERTDRLLENTSEVNAAFNEEMGSYIRLQRTCEQIFMTSGFGDLAHEPKYRADKEIKSLRLVIDAGSDLVRLRAAADYCLYSPGARKALLLEVPGGNRAGLDLAEGLALYVLVKAGYLKKKAGLTLRAGAVAPDAARLDHFRGQAVRVEEVL